MQITGKIVKIISNDCTVLSNHELYICKPSGRIRKTKMSPLVGDNVLFDKENHYILEIKKRRNELIRPSVANIDNVLIVMSAKNPDFSTNLLDKLLAIIEYNNITPIIFISKMDLLTIPELDIINNYIKYYKFIGYKVYTYDTIYELKKEFKDSITIFTGQTGSGKSTLLNKIDSSLNLKTGEISLALGRGRHTTRHVELMNIMDGLVADTPGFSDISFIGMSKMDIRDNFIDFNKFRDMCKYKDCMHDREDNCIIKDKVCDNTILKSRYDNYIKFISEVKDK